MSDTYEQTFEFLQAYFYDFSDREAIEGIKHDIVNYPTTNMRWQIVKQAIQNREFEEGIALQLVHHAANRVIMENTEEEAYVWLDNMANNIDRIDGLFEEYT